MKNWSKILITIIVLFLIIQLPFFTPKKNFSDSNTNLTITDRYKVPMNIQMDLYTSCYDCHSNYTDDYPWYYHIQPVSWWMNNHIQEAKAHLNFSEFATYTTKEASKKFKKLYQVMKKRSMPLETYLWMHEEARLTDKQYQRVARWAQKMHKKTQAKIDSTQNH